MLNFTKCAVRETQMRHYQIAIRFPFSKRQLFALNWSRFDPSIPARRIGYFIQ